MAPKKIGASEDSSILEKISNSDMASQGKRAACNVVYVSRKLLKSTGKASWLVGTTFLVLALPLIIQMERDQEFREINFEQGQ